MKPLIQLITSSLILFYGTMVMGTEKIDFHPLEHASFVITSSQSTIFVDPLGEKEELKTFPKPDLILVTDIHYDHLIADTINSIKDQKTMVIGPKAVIDILGHGSVLQNGESLSKDGVRIEAVPMYNTTPSRRFYHPKGRGNGYVITLLDQRIYVSGDTEDIPEMRGLKDIDYAFICMNLPYTMTVEQAASAVLEMTPHMVFPYHFRGSNGLSDIEKFSQLVRKNKNIQVKLLNWYP